MTGPHSGYQVNDLELKSEQQQEEMADLGILLFISIKL
jgi:hypothetical protein